MKNQTNSLEKSPLTAITTAALMAVSTSALAEEPAEERFSFGAELTAAAALPHHTLALSEHTEISGLGVATIDTHGEAALGVNAGLAVELPHGELMFFPTGITAEWSHEGFTPLYNASTLYHGEAGSVGLRVEAGFEEGLHLKKIALPIGIENRIFVQLYAAEEEGHFIPGAKGGVAVPLPFDKPKIALVPTIDMNENQATIGGMVYFGESIHFE